MKTLGLIGGISWISTIDYYRQICLGINQKMGESSTAAPPKVANIYQAGGKEPII